MFVALRACNFWESFPNVWTKQKCQFLAHIVNYLENNYYNIEIPRIAYYLIYYFDIFGHKQLNLNILNMIFSTYPNDL